MDAKKVIYIGGKQIGVNCLRILLKKGIRPELVIANMDDKGEDTWHESIVKLSKKSNLSLIQNTRLSDKKLQKQIIESNADIIFSIGGTHLIPEVILKAPKLGCFNIHPALLPKYRGRYSTVHALFNGEKNIGVTAHWMDMGIDTGPIILQRKFKVTDADTAKSVYDNFTKLGTDIFEEFVEKWIKKRVPKSKIQNEKNASYYPKGLPNDGNIDWNWNGHQIYNFIRSMTFEPFPPASFYIGKKKMVIVEEKYFKGFK